MSVAEMAGSGTARTGSGTRFVRPRIPLPLPAPAGPCCQAGRLLLSSLRDSGIEVPAGPFGATDCPFTSPSLTCRSLPGWLPAPAGIKGHCLSRLLPWLAPQSVPSLPLSHLQDLAARLADYARRNREEQLEHQLQIDSSEAATSRSTSSVGRGALWLARKALKGFREHVVPGNIIMPNDQCVRLCCPIPSVCMCVA